MQPISQKNKDRKPSLPVLSNNYILTISSRDAISKEPIARYTRFCSLSNMSMQQLGGTSPDMTTDQRFKEGILLEKNSRV